MKNWMTICMSVKEYLQGRDVGIQMLVMMVRLAELIIITGLIVSTLHHCIDTISGFHTSVCPFPLLRYLGLNI